MTAPGKRSLSPQRAEVVGQFVITIMNVGSFLDSVACSESLIVSDGSHCHERSSLHH